MSDHAIFPPSREAAVKRLAAFATHAGSVYAAKRNFDFGAGNRSNISMLSAFLRYRIITEHEVVQTVLHQHSFATSEKYIQEVLWRTYWKGWLEMRPAIWSQFVVQRDLVQDNAMHTADVSAAESGETGIEGFDDWARELVETGYLHNHARMWFASIWIFTLKLPWTLGADFFLRHLIDADPASNTLSWRWVAGLQTIGKTYLATTDNIARYTNGRFSPKGLATYAEPVGNAEPLPEPLSLPEIKNTEFAGPALLLVTAEDFNPETVVPADSSIRVALIHTSAAQKWPWGDKASVFVTDAAKDCAVRVAKHYGCQVDSIVALDATAIIAAAEAAGVKTVVTAYAAVGPVADQLQHLGQLLSASGITLVRRRRPWDERFWPHAKKGFFPFKEYMKKGLAQEGIAGKQMVLDF